MSDDRVRRDVSQNSTIDVFAVMELVNDRLQLLDYENRFCRQANPPKVPLGRLGFAVQTTSSQQFPYFSSLVLWLLQEREVNDFVPWGDYDDPAAISDKIMEQCKNLGFKADFPVSKLRHGSGAAVVSVLKFLTENVLRFKRFVLRKPVHTAYTGLDDAPSLQDAEEIDDIGIDDNFGGDDAPAADEGMNYYSAHSEKETADDFKSTRDVQESGVDPAVWKLEMERVGHMLKWKAQTSSSGWRTHLEQSKKHEKLLQQHFPDAKVSLVKISKQLREATQLIQDKELQINKDFEGLGGDFRTQQKTADALQEKYNEMNKTIADLHQTFTTVTDEVDQIKEQMKQRNNSMTDTTPLKDIKASLVELRKEVLGMELRIGVVGQTLLHMKIRHHRTETAPKSSRGQQPGEPTSARPQYY